MRQAIEITGLTKHYGKHRGVEQVSFSVSEGDIFGFLGPNGAGKSTTIRSMLGFLQYEGDIRILGKDARRDHVALLREIGYMPSEANFYPEMRVREVLRLAADVRGADCSAEAAKLCERLEVDTGRRISELSLGNRKKVSIVCAMQHRPRLFIFDEPTSGLDPLMQNTFFELIGEYVREGATCLLSTHVLPEVKRYCRNVAILKEGRLVSSGSVSDLTHTSAKRVQAVIDGEERDYLYSGDLNTLLSELAGHNVTQLNITDPSIEEIFMGYYEEKSGKEA
ncbi:MAG: ABC transporter ATP-binding protein [Lachnospiraceae bacterium]|nr:ABC transporter ATP-binding protein [Lachnospiraceae bacterium]